MFQFISRFRKAARPVTNPIDDSASLGDDPYIAQIIQSLSRRDSPSVADTGSTASAGTQDVAIPDNS